MKPKRWRHRVATRPKVRARRFRELGALLALLALAAGAAATARHMSAEFPSWRALYDGPGADWPVEVLGAPAGTEEALRAALAAGPGGPRERGQRLKERFSFVEDVAASRDWLKRRVRYQVRPFRAVARAGGMWLSATGALFSAPKGFSGEGLPKVELKGAGEAERRELAGFLDGLGPSAGAKLSGASFLSREEGWRVTLEDGTPVLWGDFNWTAEKFARLDEALGDARAARPPGAGLTADLRYFGDGKILVRAR